MTVAKRKFLVVLVCFVCATLLIVGIMYFKGIFKSKSLGDGVYYVEMRGVYDSSGKDAYISFMNGDYIKVLADDTSPGHAKISPNRKKIASLETAKIYITDTDKNDKKIITENGKDINWITDYGVFYQDKNGGLFYYLFESGDSVEFGQGMIGNVLTSTCNKYMAYHDNKSINLLDESTGETKELVKASKDNIRLNTVSDDGQYLSWSEYNDDDKEVDVYVYKQDKPIKVCAYKCESDPFDTAYDIVVKTGKNDSFSIVSKRYSDIMYILDEKNEVITADFGGNAINYMFDEEGCYNDFSKTDSFKGMYVTTQNMKNRTFEKSSEISEGGPEELYYVDREGSKLVLSGLSAYRPVFKDGNIYYFDYEEVTYTNEGTVKCAKLINHKVESTENVAEGISRFQSIDRYGEKIIYFKNYNEEKETAELYIADEKGKLKLIDSDVNCSALCVNADFSGVFYFKLSEMGKNCGDLYFYKYGESKSELIDDNVFIYTLNSGISGLHDYSDYFRIIDENSFEYNKIKSKENYDKYIGDWYYYDGKKGKMLVGDINIYLQLIYSPNEKFIK